MRSRSPAQPTAPCASWPSRWLGASKNHFPAAFAALVCLFFAAAIQAQDLNWSADVGAVGTAGDSSYDPRTQAYHVQGAGVGLTGPADAFHFAYYQAMQGNGAMTVRLSSADALAQAALVLRQSLDANSASAAVTVQNGTAQFVRRAATGNNSVVSGSVSVAAPSWLKVARSGTTVSVFVSADGQTWTSLGSDTVDLGTATVYVGLAVSNGAANAPGLASASFDGIRCTFLPGEGLQVWLKADVGISQDVNGKVSNWADQSGNGHDAMQPSAGNQPSFVAAAAAGNNGRPSVRFDGANSVLSLPGSYGQDNYTLYVVTQPTATHEIDGESTGGIAGSGGQRYLFGGYMGNSEAGTCVSVGTNGVSVYEHAPDYLPALSVYPENLHAGYASVGVRYQAKQAQILVNGALKHTGLVSPRTHVDAPSSLGFGAYGTYAGDVAEVLVYNRALSDAECQTVEDYLNAKYQYNAPPVAPTQVTAVALSATQASINWVDASSNVDAYQVERLNADGSWALVANLGAANTSYLASGLSAGSTYTFRVSATNSVGNSPATVGSLTTPATGVEFPVSGLQMWLRADTAALTDSNGLVSQWPDRSGWGNNAFQTDPSRQPILAEGVLNGQPALHFSGGTYLHLPDHLMDGANAGELILALRSTAPVGAGRGLLRLSDTGGDWVPWGGDGNFYEGFGSSQRYGPFTVPGGLYAPSFYELTSVPGRWTARVNGQVRYTTTGNSVAFPATNLWLGIDSESTPFEGDIAEVLLFNRALTGTERSVIDAYLNAKYQVAVPPVVPTGLSAAAISASQTGLSWEASVRADGYSLERKLTSDPDGAYIEVAVVTGGEVQSYIDSGLATGGSYTYRLRASNPGGYSGYSAPAVLLLPAAGAATLPTGNLLLWLKADAGLTTEAGGEVNGWADQSGHGNNALQSSQMSEPQVQVGVVNGQPALRFDGSNDFLATKQPVLTATHDATILAVVRLPDANSKGPFVKNGLNGGFGFGVGSGTLESSGNDALGIFDYVRWLNSGSQWGMGTVLAEMTLDASGNPSLYRNGQRLGSVSGGGPAGSTGPTFIGGYNFGTARFFGGDIAEVLMFDRLLTEQERQAWEGYLNAKYNFIPPPAIPTGLSVTALSSSQVLLAWTDSSPGITGYTIERQNSDGTWSVLATISGNSYVDAGLPPSSTSTYRVTASSAQGNSPTSVSVSGTTHPVAGGTDVFPVAGLQLWLRADAGIAADANGAVNVWADQSGHNHQFSQADDASRPALVGNDLNGRPAVRFDGNNDSLDGDLTSPTGREVTFFVVTRGAQYQSLLRFQDGSGNYLVYPWSASQIFINSADGGVYNGINCGLVPGEWNIAAALIKAGDRMATYRNGDLVASRAANSAALPTVNSPLILGRFVGGGEYLQGDVAEVLIYDRALSDIERETVEAFLNAKYAIIAPPAAPLALSLRAISSTQANLFWSASDHATGYLIERKNAAAGTFEQVAAVPGGEVQAYIDDNLTAGATYLYRVRAENLAGASNYSEEASVSLPETSTSDALPIDDLRLWLLPEAGVVWDSNARVSDWIDASGHGNDARQNDPSRQPTWTAGVFNGEPALRFNGNANLRLADNLLSGASAGEMLLVLRSTAPTGTGRGLLNLSAASGDWAPWDGDGMFYEGFGSSQRYGPFPVADNLNQACLYDLMSAPGQWSARKNGEVQFTSANNTVSFPTNNLTLGLSSTGICFEGEIAECVLFDHALSDSERQTWERYLNAKYQYDPPPPEPTQLTTVVLSSSQVLVSWQEDFQNVSGYVVERQNPDGTWVSIATLNAGTYSYVDSGLSGGTLYHYRVTAHNRTGNSPPSVTVGATTQTFAGGTFPASALRIWLMAGAGLKADGNGLVNAWADQSGHGAGATQTYGPERPQRVDAAVNGNPVLHFDGHQSLALSHPLDGLTAGEIMLVVRNSAGADHSTVDSFSEFYGDYFLQGDFHSQFGGTDDHAIPVQGLDNAAFNLYDACNQAGLLQAWINGALRLQTACGPVAFNPVPLLGQDYHLGRLRGDIAEVLVFERGLTPVERHAVERYCAGRYALSGMIGGEADADPDGDGRTNYQEYLAGTNPQDYYNAQTPTLHIVSGNLQTGVPDTVAAAPLNIKVTSATGTSLANAPVTFQIARSNGLLADPAAPGALNTYITVRTASDGTARVLFQSPPANSPFTSLITATSTSSAGSSHVTFVEAIVADDDTSGDGLPDGWKNRYSLDLLVNNAAGDPDGDGLSNFQEFYLGTNPLTADFTPEGVAVAWLTARGLDPRYDSVTAVDPNGQGLTYLQEYQFEQSTLDLWPFDEGANNLTVSSLLGFRDVGTLAGGPAWVNDPDGGSALRFNLVGARVDFGTPADGHLDLGSSGSFSVAARFRTTVTGSVRLLGKGEVARSGGSGFFLNLEGGQIGFGVGTATGQNSPLHILTTGTYNDGGWHHVAAVLDRVAARAKIYVDGIAQPLVLAANSAGVLQGAEADLSSTLDLSASNAVAALSVGSDDGAGHEQFWGPVDNVGLFNKALTPEEIKVLAGSQYNQPPTVALTCPLSAAVFPEGGSVPIRAEAYSAQGAVAKVELFNGTAKLGEALTPPYQFNWQAAVGNYNLLARATDARGALNNSAPVSIAVVADSDHDGLPDAWELQHFGDLSQGAAGSFLSDGISNLTKYLLGLDPTRHVNTSSAAAAEVGLQVYTPLH